MTYDRYILALESFRLTIIRSFERYDGRIKAFKKISNIKASGTYNDNIRALKMFDSDQFEGFYLGRTTTTILRALLASTTTTFVSDTEGLCLGRATTMFFLSVRSPAILRVDRNHVLALETFASNFERFLSVRRYSGSRVVRQ